jgi:transcriptional regulator with XRE-family HTH domain
VSTLSKLENGKMSLSYDKLSRLCVGLDVDIHELLSPQSALLKTERNTGRRSVTRAGEGLNLSTDTYGHLYPASDLLHKRFTPIVAELKARSLKEFGDMIQHPGEEYTFVLEGRVILHTEHYAPLTLETGDSVYFDSSMAHAYLAAGEGPAKVLSICAGDEGKLRAAMYGADGERVGEGASSPPMLQASRAQRS